MCAYRRYIYEHKNTYVVKTAATRVSVALLLLLSIPVTHFCALLSEVPRDECSSTACCSGRTKLASNHLSGPMTAEIDQNKRSQRVISQDARNTGHLS